ncbi:hypothetical protein Tco_1368705 [Tanacetum coccineum]
MEREIKRLNQSRIPLVKVRWNSRRGPEFTWEREDSCWELCIPDLVPLVILLSTASYHNVIVNGDLEEEHAPTGETSAPPAPKTAKQLAARRN